MSLASSGLLVTFYFIGIPLGCLLAFTFNLDIYGLLYGIIFGMACLNIFYSYALTIHIDWFVVAQDMQERTEKDTANLDKKEVFLDDSFKTKEV